MPGQKRTLKRALSKLKQANKQVAVAHKRQREITQKVNKERERAQKRGRSQKRGRYQKRV